VRTLAGILVISGLGALSLAGLAQHDLGIAGPGIALTGLWGLSIALRWPKTSHTACLGAAVFLCALSVILKMPVLIPLFCLSASLCAWDLALMDLRLRSHPRQATFKLTRQYARRFVPMPRALPHNPSPHSQAYGGKVVRGSKRKADGLAVRLIIESNSQS